ncbi:hypothetical protein K461DRAFT_279604 [Myriangium duriaei CBS 260.36]|uniref:Uncharacterized protein n=1 Tax=Myriangium duriaei CBS 260.36 TaxID=1168546 RepID=A0A9P4MGE5_9PEZI|nr:hypothetical protein K461DRAFT_279604 [Myriangium duriaei CBS 260.36]
MSLRGSPVQPFSINLPPAIAAPLHRPDPSTPPVDNQQEEWFSMILFCSILEVFVAISMLYYPDSFVLALIFFVLGISVSFAITDRAQKALCDWLNSGERAERRVVPRERRRRRDALGGRGADRPRARMVLVGEFRGVLWMEGA